MFKKGMCMFKMFKDCAILLCLIALPVVATGIFAYSITPDFTVGDCINIGNHKKEYRITGFALDRYVLNGKLKLNYRLVDNNSVEVECE